MIYFKSKQRSSANRM